MPVVVIGGSTKDIGKTALMCGVIEALRDFEWTAVKITAHRYDVEASPSIVDMPSGSAVWEESTAEGNTDTSRYLAAGARRALLVTRNGPAVPIEEIRSALGRDVSVILESNRIVDVMEPDVCLALAGGAATEMKPSFAKLLEHADALVSTGKSEAEIPQMHAALPRFHLAAPDRLTPELTGWLRSRLREASKRTRG